MMSNRRSCLAVAMIAAALCGPQVKAETPLVYNVVELTEQRCDGPAMIHWVRHAERDAILAAGQWTIGDTGYRVALAPLSDFREWTMLTRLRDDARGVEDNYVLFSPTGAAPMEAAYVLTRLPAGMGDADGLAVAMQLHAKELAGRSPEWTRATTPLGEAIESIVDHRQGSACYPTGSVFVDDARQTIGISRWVARDGLLIEYALIVPWPAGADRAAAVAEARAALTRFQAGLQPARAD